MLLPPPDDTVLVVASMKGSTLLAWVEHVLGIPPFFVQGARVSGIVTHGTNLQSTCCSCAAAGDCHCGELN